MSEEQIETKRMGLVVSISDYDDKDLHQLDLCRNDGEKMYEILRSQGYEKTEDFKLIGRVNYSEMRSAIIKFFKNKTIFPRDTLFFYFSGHGVLDGHGNTYLSTSEIDSADPDENGFSFDDLTKMMERRISKRIITILDCCYRRAKITKGGDEKTIAKAARDSMMETIKKKPNVDSNLGQGKCLMASSLAHQESVMLKSKGHSLFTFYLLEGLIGGGGKSVDEEGNVTPSSLGDYIDEQILGLHLGSRIDQRPILKTETSGKFILADHPKLAKKPTVPAMELNQLMTDGNQYFQDKKYHAAIEKFDEVLTLDEKHYFAYKLKGDAFMEWIKPNEALECYDKALEIKPDYLFALRGKGLAYYKLSKYNQAIECYDRALKINSKDSVTLNYKGLSYMHLEKYNDALHYFNGALELDPTYHEALRNKQKCEEIISKRRDNLLYDINEKNLIPVIGNRASSPFLPIKSEIADEWAREYDYPFEDSQKLEKESEGNI